MVVFFFWLKCNFLLLIRRLAITHRLF